MDLIPESMSFLASQRSVFIALQFQLMLVSYNTLGFVAFSVLQKTTTKLCRL